MTTSGSFTPGAEPACYEPRMTRAAALAMRAAGTLRENCVVVITDGPVIGTVGNTSPTEVELNPVSPTELGTTARVHTAFASSAWAGAYDIDLGTAGTITRLVDDWGNDVRDPDADAPTVQTQFPWHRGGTTFRDNYVEDSTLTGWDAGTGVVVRNRITGATVDLSGDWTFTDNTVGAQSTVTLAKSSTGKTFQRNQVIGANAVRSLAGATGNNFITDNVFADGYVLEVAATSTAAVTVDGCSFTGHSSAAVDAQFDGSGTRVLRDSRFSATTTTTQLALAGGGSVALTVGSEFVGGRVTRDPAATANLTVTQSRVTGEVQQNAGATSGPLLMSSATNRTPGAFLIQNGPGAITVITSTVDGSVSNAATATRGLTAQSCDIQGGTLTQNRTGGTASDTVTGLTLRSSLSSVTLNGAADPGAPQTPINQVTVESGGTVALTDPVGSGVAQVCFQNSHVSTNAIVTGTGTGLVTFCRFAARVTVNLGAFSHDASVAEGLFTLTPTANNTNRLLNKSYNDWV